MKQYQSSNHHNGHIIQFYRHNLKTKGVFGNTINLSDKQAAELKSMLSTFEKPNDLAISKEVIAQTNNQQFDVSDFESSRQYESLSIESVGLTPKTELYKSIGWIIKESSQNEGYLTNWDKATKK